jgi:hypothetical protein
MMIYSNEVEGETLTFQYYDQSANSVYYLSETMEFESNMTVGNLVSPYTFTFNPGDGGSGGGDDGDLAYTGTPEWDDNEDGVLDNYHNYENNGSITAMVTVDGAASYAQDGDMIAAFVGDEQRGVGVTSLVPFGPYQGTYQFPIMIYSNEVEGETLTFQYYDQSANSVYYLSETMEFESNMTVGNLVSPYTFTFNPGDGGSGGGDDGDLAYTGTPEWDDNEDGVLDNYHNYENNGSITAMVTVDGAASYAQDGDMIAAFVGDEQRGVGVAGEVPDFLGGGHAFLIMVYSNTASGETLTFEYYNAAT